MHKEKFLLILLKYKYFRKRAEEVFNYRFNETSFLTLLYIVYYDRSDIKSIMGYISSDHDNVFNACKDLSLSGFIKLKRREGEKTNYYVLDNKGREFYALIKYEVESI